MIGAPLASAAVVVVDDVNDGDTVSFLCVVAFTETKSVVVVVVVITSCFSLFSLC